MIGRIGAQARRQVGARGVDRRLHVARRAVDVAVEAELQRERASMPSELVEVISVTSAIWPRWRSSGAATRVAIVSGLAPGMLACTEMVGKSTCGSGDTGSWPKASRPASAMPMVSSVVATGRRMNSSEKRLFTAPPPAIAPLTQPSAEARADALEEQIDHRRGEQRQHLADRETADDRQAERMAQLRADAGAQHQRQRAEHRRHRRHQDRPQAQQAGLVDRRRARRALRRAARRARSRSS